MTESDNLGMVSTSGSKTTSRLVGLVLPPLAGCLRSPSQLPDRLGPIRLSGCRRSPGEERKRVRDLPVIKEVTAT
jgi:hypothetical protein